MMIAASALRHGAIPAGRVLATLHESMPTHDRWLNEGEKPPAEITRWTTGEFLLPRFPYRYDDWGIRASWKAPVLEEVLRGLDFHGKRSTPYAPGSIHDFMHAKVTVVDDALFVGSYNLSRSGEENAENVLEIEDAALADRIAAWIDAVRARYPDAR